MTTHYQPLVGLRAIVTGGASGIGLATSRELTARGAEVAVIDLDVSAVEGEFRTVTADVATDEVAKAIAELASDGLDAVVNNAAVGAIGTFADHDLDEWRRVFDINVLGIVRVSTAALPYLRASGSASITNIASIAAVQGLPLRAIYTASKGAVAALTRSMAADLLADGIRVNSVLPGTVDTPWVGRLLDAATDRDDAKARLMARQPTGHLVASEEVARAVAHLVDPASASSQGTSLVVDGGLHSLRGVSS